MRPFWHWERKKRRGGQARVQIICREKKKAPQKALLFKTKKAI
jgi:hypothetical protein